MNKSTIADIAASITTIVVGSPASGNSLAAASAPEELVEPVEPERVVTGVGFTVVVVEPVARVAVGFGAALRIGDLRLVGAENSRIESIPALIVVSESESAAVIVRIYEAPAINDESVVIVTEDLSRAPDLSRVPVIEAIWIFSFDPWSMIRTRIELAYTDWLNLRVRLWVFSTFTVSRRSGRFFGWGTVTGLVPITADVPVEPVAVVEPVAAETGETIAVVMIIIKATKESRDID